MLDITTLTFISVAQFLHQNQFLRVATSEEGHKVLVFQSYATTIAYFDTETHDLVINWDKWDCSKTTLYHFSKFIELLTPYTYENRIQFAKEIKNNPKIHTY